MKKSILAIVMSMALAVSALFSMPAMATGYVASSEPVTLFAETITLKDINAPLFAEPAVDDSDSLGIGITTRMYSGNVMYAYLETVAGHPDHPVPALASAVIATAVKVPI